jgi:hypothetical protein
MSTSGELKSLVDSIRKHKNFKQLASYGIKSLGAFCSPPMGNWQSNAETAYSFGACEAIADVLARNSRDSELFSHSLLHLQATASVGFGSGLVASGVVGATLRAFADYHQAAELPSSEDAIRSGLIVFGNYSSKGPDAEAVSVVENLLRFASFICTQAKDEAAAPTAPGDARVVDRLISLLPVLPTPLSVRLCFVALENLSRSDSGLATLASSSSHITTLVNCASVLYGVGENVPSTDKSGSKSPSASRASRVMEASGGKAQVSTTSTGRRQLSMGAGLSSGFTSSGSLSRLNAHLEPSFRLLDRLSRDTVGLEKLRASNVLSQLASAVEFAQIGPIVCDPSVGQLGVRILARILGTDLKKLVDRISVGSRSTSGVYSDCEFAASLLASLSIDPDVSARLLSSNLIPVLIDLFNANGGQACSSKTAASLCQAVRRIASHGAQCFQAVIDSNAVPVIMRVARSTAAAAESSRLSASDQASQYVSTEAFSALADLISSEELVLEADKAGNGGVDFALSVLRSRGSADSNLALSCLRFLHACVCYNWSVSSLINGGIVTAILSTLSSPASKANEFVDLQTTGLLILSIIVAKAPETTESAFAGGGSVAIALSNLLLRNGNLCSSCESSSGSSANLQSNLLLISANLINRPSLSQANESLISSQSDVFAASNDESVSESDSSSSSGSASLDAHAILTAITLHFLVEMCKTACVDDPTLVAASKARISTARSKGLLRAMLSAYARFRANNAVHDCFSDLVELVVEENEVIDAVLALRHSTVLLKDSCGDPGLFSIAEQDLGREGVLADDGVTILAASASDSDDNSVPASAKKFATAATTGPISPLANTRSKVARPGMKESVLSTALRSIECLCLLEAVTNSVRLSGVLVKAQGVSVLVRTICVVSVTRARIEGSNDSARSGGAVLSKAKSMAQLQQKAEASAAGKGGTDPDADRSISETLQEEILARSCDILAGIARLNIDSQNGNIGFDPIPTSLAHIASDSGNTIQSGSSTSGSHHSASKSSHHRRLRSGKTTGEALLQVRTLMGNALFRPVVLRVLTKVINSKSNLKRLVSSASLALGVLSQGTLGVRPTCSPLDYMITQGAVEAIVSAMRAHPNALIVILSASSGLGLVCIAGRSIDLETGQLTLPAPPETIGSAALATRGATRQMIRELQNAADAGSTSGPLGRWGGNLGQATLCAILRVLLVIAETSKGADLLKKQGCVDALVATLDLAATLEGGFDVIGNSTSSVSAGGSEKVKVSDDKSASTNENTGNTNSVMTLLSGDSSSNSNSSDAQTSTSGTSSSSSSFSAESKRLAIATLSKLMDLKDLQDALAVIHLSAEKASELQLKPQGVAFCSVALTTVLALAGSEQGRKAGARVWAEAFDACRILITSINKGASLCVAPMQGSQAVSISQQDRTIAANQAIAVLLPSASRCIEAVSQFRAESFADLNTSDPSVDKLWNSAFAFGAQCLIKSLELAAHVGDLASLASSFTSDLVAQGAARAASDRLSSSYNSGIHYILGALLSIARIDSEFDITFTANAIVNASVVETKSPNLSNSTTNPFSSLIRVISRAADDGNVDIVAGVVEVLELFSRGHVSDHIDHSFHFSHDAFAALLSLNPPGVRSAAKQPVVGLVLERALKEFMSSQASAVAFGSVLLLLSKLTCHQLHVYQKTKQTSFSPYDESLVRYLHSCGYIDFTQQALFRFCSPEVLSETVESDVGSSFTEGYQTQSAAAMILEGVSIFATGMIIDSISIKDFETTQALLILIIGFARDDSTRLLVASSNAMTALCELVSASCTESKTYSISKEMAEASRTAVLKNAGRDVIIEALSNPNADSHLLKSGARALKALGGGSSTGAVVELLRAVDSLRRAFQLRSHKGKGSESENALISPKSATSSVSGSSSSDGDSDTETLLSAYQAISRMQTILRDLGAALAGVSSITPSSLRYVFDALVSAVDAAVSSRDLAPGGTVSLAPPSTPASSPTINITQAISKHIHTQSAHSESHTLISMDEHLEAFTQHCNTSIASGIQCISRLISVEVVRNTSTLSIFEASSDEIKLLGDPKGASSSIFVEKTHAMLERLLVKSGMSDSAKYHVCATVTAADVMDVLSNALQLRGSSILSADVADSVGRLLSEMCLASESRQLFPVAGAIVASSCVIKAEIVWAFASRGLSQALMSLLSSEDGSYDIPGQVASSSPTSSSSSPSHSLSTAAALRLSPGIQSLLRIASDPDVQSIIFASLLDASNDQSLNSDLVTLFVSTGASGVPLELRGSANWRSFSTSMTAGFTPLDITLQLLYVSEAFSRPSPSELSTLVNEVFPSDSLTVDPFEHSFEVLSHLFMSSRLEYVKEDALKSLARGLSFNAPTCASWAVLSSLSDITSELSVIGSPRSDSSTKKSTYVSTFARTRILAEILDQLRRSVSTAAALNPTKTIASLVLDAPIVLGHLTRTAALFSVWARFSASSLEHVGDDKIPSIGISRQIDTKDSQSVSLVPDTVSALSLIYCRLSRSIVFSSVVLLGHTDFNEEKDERMSSTNLASPSGAKVQSLESLLSDPTTVSMIRCILRQRGAYMLATAGIEVIRRFCGLNSNGLAAKSNINIPLVNSKLRIRALVEGGVFLRVVIALGVHSSSSFVYAREVVRLLHDLGMSLAIQEKSSNTLYNGKILCDLGLNEDCLRALQTVTKRHSGADEVVKTFGPRLIAALGEVYSSISAEGFLDALERACIASESCSHVRIKVENDVVIIADKAAAATAVDASSPPIVARARAVLRATTLSDEPESLRLLIKACEVLSVVCAGIEADAVPVVPTLLLRRVVDSVISLKGDVALSTVFASSLARSCDNSINATELVQKTPAIDNILSFARSHALVDIRAAEAVILFLRPVSQKLPFVAPLKVKGAVPLICQLLEAHLNVMLPKSTKHVIEISRGEKEIVGSENQALSSMLASPTSTSDKALPLSRSSEAIELEPRIAHACVQCLANIACDQSFESETTLASSLGQSWTDVREFITMSEFDDAPCSSGVARIVAANGVSALSKCMDAHLSRPRILEDSLCALSNISFACHGVRLAIGRSCSPLIVSALCVFNSDPFLFSMALRAVGNLTRADENIVSTVANGVIAGIMEGMQKNNSKVDVLNLAADVVGNLASIDESAIQYNDGLRALEIGLERRNLKDSVKSKSVITSLQDTVAEWLLDDGAHAGLLDAMLRFSTDARLVSACLRSLQYLADSNSRIERMQSSADIARKACQVMRSCDFDAELSVRGALLLQQLLKCNIGSAARTGALDAGCAQVLLSSLETHRNNIEVISTVIGVIKGSIAIEPSTLSAARELSSIKTLLAILDGSSRVIAAHGGSVSVASASDAARIAAAAGAPGMPLPPPPTPIEVVSGAGLPGFSAEESIAILPDCLELLRLWSTGDSEFASRIAGPASLILVDNLLKPTASGSSFSDIGLVEMCFNFMRSLALLSPSVSKAVITTPGLLDEVLRSIPKSLDHLGNISIVRDTVKLFAATAAASPSVALDALKAGGHGVCMGIAAHLAINREGRDETDRRSIYEGAGSAIRMMISVAEPLLVDLALENERLDAEKKAAEEQRAAAQPVSNTRRVSIVFERGRSTSFSAAFSQRTIPAPEEGIDGISRVDSQKRRQNFGGVDHLTPKGRATDVKNKLAASRAREKAAIKLAAVYSKRTDLNQAFNVNDILEMRAGMMPWALFPRTNISLLTGELQQMKGVNDINCTVFADVWFSPDMHSMGKLKVRRMRLSLSPDLTTLTWSYASLRFKRTLDWSLSLSRVSRVRVGVPTPAEGPSRRSLFSFRSANTTRSVVLEDESNTLFHAELPDGAQQDSLLRVLSVAVSYASVRAGVKLPLPEPSEASLRIALAAASTAAAALATTAAATSVVPASPPKPPSTTSSIGLISLHELPQTTEKKIIDSEVS